MNRKAEAEREKFYNFYRPHGVVTWEDTLRGT